ncbi:hypothetical protein ACIA2T_01555 [Amycolatopsis japonica]|uniref:hypothetical protein n=1 Tax=Amycolatopsis japonica TaxID=208439 RepID=UPI0037BBAD7C
MADTILAPGPQLQLPPSVVEQIVQKFKETAFEIAKSEVTGVKGEVNGLIATVNAVKAEYTVFKFEPPPFFDLWAKLEQRKLDSLKQLPSQLKARADAAFELAEKAMQAAKPPRSVTDLATKAAVEANDKAVREKINTNHTNINARVSQLITHTTERFTKINLRVTGVDERLSKERGNLSARIAKLENQKSGQGKSPAGADTKKLRDEAARTRKAAKDLESAVRGTSAPMRQFATDSKQAAQSLR